MSVFQLFFLSLCVVVLSVYFLWKLTLGCSCSSEVCTQLRPLLGLGREMWLGGRVRLKDRWGDGCGQCDRKRL